MQTIRKPVVVADLRPTLTYFFLGFVIIAAGLLLRFVTAGLPVFLVKYGGSFLWAGMVYFLIAAVQAYRRPAILAIMAAVVAAFVELSRLYHTPGLDAFRLTLAGALLLGRVFDPWHLLAYGSAIVVAAVMDAAIIRPRFAVRRT